jgi:hypothetical protein
MNPPWQIACPFTISSRTAIASIARRSDPIDRHAKGARCPIALEHARTDTLRERLGFVTRRPMIIGHSEPDSTMRHYSDSGSTGCHGGAH